mgnify:CR=1 FL=1
MKNFILILLVLFSTESFSNENLLTIQQQVDRLQREVSDLSKSIFSNSSNNSENNLDKNNLDKNLVTNLSAIDIRIYDLEKDVKNLNANLEEIYFAIEDISKKFIGLEDIINSIQDNLSTQPLVNETNQNSENIINKNTNNNENTLGSLKISQENETIENSEQIDNSEQILDKNNDEKNIEITLSPEDQFQSAFDNIRKKKWELAKSSLTKFIELNPENQLSGSAHYWLGELHILENKYRDAALVFAEGYQKYPKSIKAPDMLFKLSLSLHQINKKDDACKTTEKFKEEYPKHKLINKINKQIISFDCIQSIE